MGKDEKLGTVVRIMPYGAFVKLEEGGVGLIHISQFDDKFVEDAHAFIDVGEKVLVKVIGKGKKGKLNLTFVRRVSKEEIEQEKKDEFELKMKKFLRDSQDSLTANKRRLKRKIKRI